MTVAEGERTTSRFVRGLQGIAPFLAAYVAIESGLHIAGEWFGIPVTVPFLIEHRLLYAAVTSVAYVLFFLHWGYSIYEGRRPLIQMLILLFLFGPPIGLGLLLPTPPPTLIPGQPYLTFQNGKIGFDYSPLPPPMPLPQKRLP